MTDKDIEEQAWLRDPLGNASVEGSAPDATAPPPETPTATAPQPIAFEFRGNGKEYFKIWIVNLALTIATAGIYSPWAKVRNLRYFYGNTYLDGSAFEFLGSPIAILKGRIIAVLAFGCYWITANFYPFANLFLLPIFALLFPWVFVKTLTFRSRNSAYRNLTFSYYGGYRQIAAAYLGLPLLMVGAMAAAYMMSGIPMHLPGGVPAQLSPAVGAKAGILFSVAVLGISLLFPYYYFLQKRVFAEPRNFGDSPFVFAAGPRDFYRLMFKLSLLSILAVVAVLAVMGVAGVFNKGKAAVAPHGMLYVSIISIFGFGLFQLLLFVAFKTWTRNLVLSAVRIGEAQVESRLRVLDVFFLYLSNIIAVICTLGLLIPWAKVRLARYQLGKTSLMSPEGTENFTGSPGASASAVGEELADFFDLDLAI